MYILSEADSVFIDVIYPENVVISGHDDYLMLQQNNKIKTGCLDESWAHHLNLGQFTNNNKGCISGTRDFHLTMIPDLRVTFILQ